MSPYAYEPRMYLSKYRRKCRAAVLPLILFLRCFTHKFSGLRYYNNHNDHHPCIQRVAYESLGCWGANGVGYQIRFQSSASLGPRSSSSYGVRGGGQQQRKPRLVFITEGLLLRQVRMRERRNVFVWSCIRFIHCIITYIIAIPSHDFQ